ALLKSKSHISFLEECGIPQSIAAYIVPSNDIISLQTSSIMNMLEITAHSAGISVDEFLSALPQEMQDALKSPESILNFQSISAPGAPNESGLTILEKAQSKIPLSKNEMRQIYSDHPEFSLSPHGSDLRKVLFDFE